MAKKISKHSRAARRGYVDEGTTKDLESVPKPENDALKKSIIRTTIKNENLLNAKMENKVKKNKKKTSALKNKLERSDKVSGILTTKIEQSIARAKYVQSSRKAGWDQINKSVMNDILNSKRKAQDSLEEGEVRKTEAELEKEAEDEYVRKFYEDDDIEPETTTVTRPANKFALLEETEA